MNNLIIYAGENVNLCAAILADALNRIPGVEKLNEPRSEEEGPRYAYEFNGDSTYVELLDAKYISIGRDGDASLNLALELQRHFPMPLIAFDAGYSFEVNLKEVHSIEEFRQRME